MQKTIDFMIKNPSLTQPLIARRDFLKTLSTAATAAAVSDATLAFAQDAAPNITLAFVGCAHIHTPGFINLLKSRKDVKVKWVWDHDAARAGKRAQELGCKATAEAKDIWSDPEVAGVVICAETTRHRELVNAATAANKHLFVEKPLGITAEESYAMAEAIEKAKRLFTTGYFMRTMPQHLFLKEQIAQGAFGKITRIRGSNCHSGSLGGWFDTEWRWMADPKISGVGAFGDLGTHSLDILMWLLGDIDSVTADIKVITGRYGDCDETGEAVFNFKSGVIGTLAAGWVDIDNPVSLEISGTEGHAVIFKNDLYFASKKVTGADGKKPWTVLPPAPPLPLNQFVNAIQGKTGMPLVTPREAAARVSVMEAAYKAARANTWAKPV
jgi:predicted dehydrogenase